MKRRNKYSIAAISLILFTLVAGKFTGLWGDAERDPYYQALKNIKIFGQIYQEVNDRYIEEVDPERFIRAGIEGMLDRLDPYTVYLEQEGRDELEIMTRGRYYGVGMRIVMRNGFATVAEQPFPGSPAFRAGIREGDQIVEIDGVSTKGAKLSKTASRLRGEKKGSEVSIKISRVGAGDHLAFTLIRDEIVATDIQYAGFVEPGIGLIKLTRFNRGADDQIRDSIQTLLDQGLDGLVLDLRSNPGGLLDVAVGVADLFAAKNDLIVYTEGRGETRRQEYRSQHDPILGQIPLVILVDGMSASASEIVAGAIQDLDRGVIIGTSTFGKGLVQTVIPLDRRGEMQLKLTTMQYFMPSGRYIQKPDIFDRGHGSVFINAEDQDDAAEGGEEDDATQPVEKKNDDKQNIEKDGKVYKTRNGRLVRGSGGIKPDLEVKNALMNRYEIELLRRSMVFNFSLDYVAKHPDLAADFNVDQKILDEFFRFAESKSFDYKPDGYEELDNLEKIAREEKYYDRIESHIKAIQKEFETVKEKEQMAAQDYLRILIKSEINGKLFGKDLSTAAFFANDSTLQRGVEVLKNKDEYNRLLNANLALQK